ncbi:MAG: ATP-dependent protease, partial [Acidimicrobiales bacterium]
MQKNKNHLLENENRVALKKLRRDTKLSAVSASSAKYDGFLGQDRAKAAAELAANIDDKGFNLFVAAPRATPVLPALNSLLEQFSADRPTPDDWAYVFNFASPHSPKALRFPAGKAKVFRASVRDMIQDLMAAIPAAFEKPDIQNQRQALKETFKQKQEDAFEKLGEDARERGVAIMRTPMGFSLVPMRDDKVLGSDVVKMLSSDKQKEIEVNIKQTEKELQTLVETVPKWERELRDGLRRLERETVEAAITQSIEVAKRELCEFAEACSHLDAIRRDLVDNVALFVHYQELQEILQTQSSGDDISLGPFDRYDVNVLVDNSAKKVGAPVIEESHPTLAHLVGRVEHRAEAGVLTTNFKLIKPGALHLANGGFLILNASRLLSEPMSWFALKRALQTGCIKTESLAEALNLTSTITLEPTPIPLSIKIII